MLVHWYLMHAGGLVRVGPTYRSPTPTASVQQGSPAYSSVGEMPTTAAALAAQVAPAAVRGYTDYYYGLGGFEHLSSWALNMEGQRARSQLHIGVWETMSLELHILALHDVASIPEPSPCPTHRWQSGHASQHPRPAAA